MSWLSSMTRMRIRGCPAIGEGSTRRMHRGSTDLNAPDDARRAGDGGVQDEDGPKTKARTRLRARAKSSPDDRNLLRPLRFAQAAYRQICGSAQATQPAIKPTLKTRPGPREKRVNPKILRTRGESVPGKWMASFCRC